MTSQQTWDPERYDRYARFVSDLGMPVVELLAPKPGERILDLGCGDGVLTEKLTALGCVVVGVDGSAARDRRGTRGSLCLPHRTGVPRPLAGARLHRAIHRLDPAAHAAAGRHHRLAGNVCRKLHCGAARD